MKNLLNLRIPSFVGIILLLLGVGVTSFLVDQGVILEGRAAPQEEPSNIAITNVSPTTVTIIYTTDEAVPGTIKYGTDSETSSVALDDRDKQNGSPSPSEVHYITISDLKPDTTYYFSILSGNTLYTNDGEPYEVTTASDLPEMPEDLAPITGKVSIPETEKTDNSYIVLLTSEETQDKSALVTNGSYTIPLDGIRTKDLAAYVTPDNDLLYDLVILDHDKKSEITVLSENTNPVPLVMFGQSYDFTMSNEPLGLPIEESASQSAQSTYPDTDTQGKPTSISIESPTNQETFSDDQPLFTGTGVPGEEVSILIESDPIQASVEIDPDGSWEFRPETPLPPGNHTITIKTKDLAGTLKTVTRSFTVFAQGGNFIEPSVSPTKTVTPTLALLSDTPTPQAVTMTETPTPTVFEPTATPTTVATASAEPTRAPLEPTGPEDTVLYLFMGISAVIGGAILFFLTKGSTV